MVLLCIGLDGGCAGNGGGGLRGVVSLPLHPYYYVVPLAVFPSLLHQKPRRPTLRVGLQNLTRNSLASGAHHVSSGVLDPN